MFHFPLSGESPSTGSVSNTAENLRWVTVLRQAGMHLWDKHAAQEGKETGGGWGCVTMGTETFGVEKGGEVVPVSWLFGPVSNRYTHTHEFHRFGGRNRQTGRREKLSTLQAIQSLSRSYSQSDTQQQPRRVEEENKSRCVVVIQLWVVMESWLLKSTLISNGFLVYVQIKTLTVLEIKV